MKRFCKQMAGTAGLLFILAACSNNSSSYPEEYVGFEKAHQKLFVRQKQRHRRVRRKDYCR